MSYVKNYLVVVDGPIGYQTINQIADNAAEMRTQMLVEHGDVEYLPGVARKGAPAFDVHQLGRHDLEEIARSVGYALLYAQSVTTVGMGMQWTGPGIPSIWKVGTGDYLMPVVGLSSFWATAAPVGGSTVTYLPPQVRPFYASAANGNNSGLRINTYKLDAGDFVAADMSFTIALYGAP